MATYAHIDVAWRWPQQEGLQQSDSTFRSALRVLDAFPQLRFSETSASYYAWIRTTDPSTFARIARMVEEGRWEPIGGWWTEADVNIVSGESLMRQAWFGQREFREHLGTGTSVAFLPDSFGSSANLPAILRAQGFDYYVMGRGTFADGTIPRGAFVWRSLGDSSIVAYNNPVIGGTNDAIKTVDDAAKLGNNLLVWFGLGDHGGGPTMESVGALTQYLEAPGAPKVQFTRVEPYLRCIGPPVTSKRGEIEGVFPGAYTNCYDMKRSTIDAERALIDCERYDVLATLCNVELPLPDLDDLWETLLLNQHHDTISATGLRANIEAAIVQNRSVADRAYDRSRVYLESILDRIPHSPDDDATLVIFNPLPHAVRAVARYPLSVPPGKVPNVFDSSGSPVAVQIASADEIIYHNQSPPTCVMAELPAFGYAAYRVKGSSDLPPTPSQQVPGILESSALSVQLDNLSGLPSILRDPEGTVVLSRPRFAIFDDREDTWASNGLATYPEFGAFDLRSQRLLEQGPVRTVIEGTYAFRASRLVVRTELWNGERAVRFTIDADWNEPFMRYALALDVPGATAFYDIPFGVIERPSTPSIASGVSFVARGRKPRGLLAVVSCGSHGFWASSATIGVTLARSTPYSSLDTVDPGATDFQDTGRRRVSVMILLSDDVAELRRASDAFQRTFPVLWSGVHDGNAAPRASFARIPSGVTLASARRTAGTTELRLHNLNADNVEANGQLGSAAFGLKLDPFGIRTLGLGGARFEDVTRG
ncbi:MAG: glycoside hydrolase family 38 C-terminal domain-containing protein [Candidatus Aquilonibacter sp.]